MWATRSNYDRHVFELLLDGFVELPGPDPRPMISATVASAAADYRVH